MEGEGDEDEGPLEDSDEGQGVEEEDLFGVGERAVEDLEVGDDVLDEEGADGNDSGERVELAPRRRNGPRRRGVAVLRGVWGLAVRWWP